MRHDQRRPDQLRPLSFQRGFTRQAPGSVLVQSGETMVLCTCSVEESVPPFLVGRGKGWLTAEYAMLPGSTNTRKARTSMGKVDGRSVDVKAYRNMFLAVSVGKGPHRVVLAYDPPEARVAARVSLAGSMLMLLMLSGFDPTRLISQGRPC